MAEQQAMASSQGVDATNSSREEVGDAEKNPAISNQHWEDTKGQAITKALVGDEVYLCADITDITDGAAATIKIVEKDADGTDDPLTTLSAVVSGGRIKCRWKVTYTADEDDADSQKELEEKGYTLPEYAFVVECGWATSGESGVLEVRDGKLHLCYESKFKELTHYHLVEMIKTNPPLANPFYIYKEFSENNPELLVRNKDIKY